MEQDSESPSVQNVVYQKQQICHLSFFTPAIFSSYLDWYKSTGMSELINTESTEIQWWLRKIN